MVSIWTLTRFAGPTAAAFVLRGRGFTPTESERLAGVLQRDLRGEFAALSEADKRRALFVCWLIDHGRLSDGEPHDAHDLHGIEGALSAHGHAASYARSAA